jgi:hypothetical protein
MREVLRARGNGLSKKGRYPDIIKAKGSDFNASSERGIDSLDFIYSQ